jgi:hypothetical protein
VKLGITAMSSFSLVVEHVKSLKRNKLTLLNPKDTLSKVRITGGIKSLKRNKLTLLNYKDTFSKYIQRAC